MIKNKINIDIIKEIQKIIKNNLIIFLIELFTNLI